MVLASPTHTRLSEAVPQNAWSGRWKVSRANMFILFDTGEGMVGIGVAAGIAGILEGVIVCIPVTFDSVNAASIERENIPAIKPPNRQMPSSVETNQRVFICRPRV